MTHWVSPKYVSFSSFGRSPKHRGPCCCGSLRLPLTGFFIRSTRDSAKRARGITMFCTHMPPLQSQTLELQTLGHVTQGLAPQHTLAAPPQPPLHTLCAVCFHSSPVQHAHPQEFPVLYVSVVQLVLKMHPQRGQLAAIHRNPTRGCSPGILRQAPCKAQRISAADCLLAAGSVLHSAPMWYTRGIASAAVHARAPQALSLLPTT
jgi:hypothetical protein